VVEVGTQVTI